MQRGANFSFAKKKKDLETLEQEEETNERMEEQNMEQNRLNFENAKRATVEFHKNQKKQQQVQLLKNKKSIDKQHNYHFTL